MRFKFSTYTSHIICSMPEQQLTLLWSLIGRIMVALGFYNVMWVKNRTLGVEYVCNVNDEATSLESPTAPLLQNSPVVQTH